MTTAQFKGNEMLNGPMGDATTDMLIGKADGMVATAFREVQAEMVSEVTGDEMASVKRRVRAAVIRQKELVTRLESLQNELNEITVEMRALDAGMKKAETENDASGLPEDPEAAKRVRAADFAQFVQQNPAGILHANGHITALRELVSCGCPACSSSRRGRIR